MEIAKYLYFGLLIGALFGCSMFLVTGNAAGRLVNRVVENYTPWTSCILLGYNTSGASYIYTCSNITAQGLITRSGPLTNGSVPEVVSKESITNNSIEIFLYAIGKNATYNKTT